MKSLGRELRDLGAHKTRLPLKSTPSCQFRLLAQPRLHGLFVREVLVFLLFKGKQCRADMAALTTGIDRRVYSILSPKQQKYQNFPYKKAVREWLR